MNSHQFQGKGGMEGVQQGRPPHTPCAFCGVGQAKTFLLGGTPTLLCTAHQRKYSLGRFQRTIIAAPKDKHSVWVDLPMDVWEGILNHLQRSRGESRNTVICKLLRKGLEANA